MTEQATLQLKQRHAKAKRLIRDLARVLYDTTDALAAGGYGKGDRAYDRVTRAVARAEAFLADEE